MDKMCFCFHKNCDIETLITEKKILFNDINPFEFEAMQKPILKIILNNAF